MRVLTMKMPPSVTSSITNAERPPIVAAHGAGIHRAHQALPEGLGERELIASFRLNARQDQDGGRHQNSDDRDEG